MRPPETSRTESLPTVNGDVVVIEYSEQSRGRWTPHSIVTTSATWNAYWSKYHACTLVHESGSGGTEHVVGVFVKPEPPPCRIWVAKEVRLVTGGGIRSELPVSERMLRRFGYDRIPAPLGDPFENTIDCDVEYCQVCADYFSIDDHCQHMSWSDESLCMVGAGIGDSQAMRRVRESFVHAKNKLGWLRCLDLVACLRHGCQDQGPLEEARNTLYYDKGYDSWESAMRWLGTIGPGRKLAKARARTISMILGENDADHGSSRLEFTIHSFSNLVREHARAIDGISRAYVAPDGLRFIMCGPLKPGIVRQVAQAICQIQKIVDRTARCFVDGGYSPDETPIVDWVTVFVRSA